MNKFTSTTTLILIITSLSLSQVNEQYPSPMVEHSRAHGRIEQKDYPGILFSIDSLLATPIQVYIPERTDQDSSYNLIIHFHGIPYVPIYAAYHTNVSIIMAVVNCGHGSSAYECAFAGNHKFAQIIDSLKVELQRRKMSKARINKIYLSSFSAGYGAVRAILNTESYFKSIDGIMLLDGLHTDYIPDRTVLAEGGRLNTDKLQPFLNFAHYAMQRSKKLLITHSEIFPGTYASTTETADFLIQALALKREPTMKWGQLGMQQLSEANQGYLLILGYAGNSAPDHIDHFHALFYFLEIFMNITYK